MNPTCSQCESSKAPLTCGLCSVHLCKSCAEQVDDGFFSFLPKVPDEANQLTYCRECYDSRVASHVADYNDLMEKAKDIRVYFKNQSQETRLLKRKAHAVKVVDCEDYHEAILRLAFLAAQSGHNAVVDLDLSPRKVKHGRWQKTLWSGSALPTNLDAKRMAREVPQIPNPN